MATINGTSGNDNLVGTVDDDDIFGFDGDDTMVGGAGADYFQGDAGFDTADYSALLTGVTIDMQTASTGGEAEGDTYHLTTERVIGTQGNDIMYGRNFSTVETLDGGAGDDILEGRHGADTLIGGAGIDTASFAQDTYTGGVIVDLTTGMGSGASSAADSLGDTYTGIENIIGSNFNDILTGDAGINVINGGGGDDVMHATAGADAYDGGVGTLDLVTYDVYAAAGVTLSLQAGMGTGGIATGDTYVNVERVTGSKFVDDITGDAANNQLFGNDGNDMLSGLDGDDDFFGGNDDDTMVGGAGADYFQGDAGFDTADYSALLTGVTIDMQTASTGGEAEGDTYHLTTERVIGTQGNDIMYGRNFSTVETLDGGAGDDILEGRHGADTLIGGAGIDTASFAQDTYTGGVIVDLTTGMGSGASSAADSLGDTYTGIENIIGSNFNDILTGDAGINVINGGGGDDVMHATAGADAYDGGVGTLDLVTYDVYAAAGVTLSLQAGMGTGGIATGDTYVNVERVTGSKFVDDITGDAANNQLFGNDGNDMLSGLDGDDDFFGGNDDDTMVGGAGADYFQGDAGFDTADYSALLTGVTIDMQTASTGGEAEGDTYHLTTERVIGTQGNDIMYGRNFSTVETLDGGAGDDILEGRHGADTLIGGAGIDTASFAQDTYTGGVIVDLTTGMGSGASSAADSLGDTYTGIENIIGSNFNDILTGDAGINVINGGGGDDVMHATAGADAYDGGVGTLDLVTYDVYAAAGVTLSLQAGMGTGGIATGDTYVNVERVTGSKFVDDITGDAANNQLFGNDGNDMLSGLDGDDDFFGGNDDDTMVGGAGADYFQGDAGFDTADYSALLTGVTIDMQTASTGGEAEGDTYHLTTERVIGTQGNDIMYGRNFSTVETLDGGAGDDILEGRHGADTLIGGAGIDTASFAQDTYTGGVIVDLTTGMGSGASSAADSLGDTYTGIENIIGSNFNDILTGDAGINVINGGGGDDVMHATAGADAYDGGVGTLDLVTYDVYAAAGVTLSLQAGMGTGGIATGDTYVNVERVTGSKFVDDITGDAANNQLFGNDGNDMLSGLDGDDDFFGGNDDDTMVGGAGADYFQGDAGFDTADYSALLTGVTIDMQTASTGGEAEGDTYHLTTERVIGTQGNDIMYGRNFSTVETLDGGAGDDILEGRHGADTLIGGAGIDTASFAQDTYTGGVIVDLTTGMGSGASSAADSLGDTYTGIENIIGSNFNDILTGDAGINVINGGGGVDNINAAGGNDTIIVLDGDQIDNINGGTGVDTLDVSNVSFDPITFDLAAGTWTGLGGTRSITGIEIITATALADIIIGGVADDVLNAGGGDDLIEGGAGADTLDGGAGNDTASYAGSNAAVTVNLMTNVHTGGHAAGDTLTGIENITGSAFGDNLTGDNGNNTLDGGNGADILNGLGGDDVLRGGFSADQLFGGDGNDLLEGSFADDIIDGGADIDTADYTGFGGGITVNLNITTAQNTGAGGSDTITNVENILGGQFNDRLTGSVGSGGDNVLEGGAGSDFLFGLGGTDTLLGGDLNDNIQGGGGMDHLEGGAGLDTLLGGSGVDTLFGNDGNDQLRGGTDSDTLTGGLGRDVLIGGNVVGGGFPGDGAADTFVINSVAESSLGGATRDIIRDFEDGLDIMQLDGIDAITGGADDAFTFIGSASFSNTAGELRAFNAGANTVVRGDVDGDGVGDLEIFINGTFTLDAGDFVL